MMTTEDYWKKRHCIYFLSSSDCPTIPRYIGRTDKPSSRKANHIAFARAGKNNMAVYDWIRGLLSSGKELILTVRTSGLTSAEAHIEELRQISSCPVLLFNHNQSDISVYTEITEPPELYGKTDTVKAKRRIELGQVGGQNATP